MIVAKATPNNRLQALDVFRGLTIAAMVLVNNPGTWAAVYPPLRHAEWHGCTPTDLIFPFFLVAVGWSMSVNARARGARASTVEHALPSRSGWRKCVRLLSRTAVLLGLGLLLATFPTFDLHNFRIPGVLQRIAVAGLVASVLVLVFRWVWLQMLIGLMVLVGYSIVLRLNPPIGGASGIAGDVSELGNFARTIDSAIFPPSRLYKGGATTDPEGLLSTAPAVISVMIGYWMGLWINAKRRLVNAGCAVGEVPVTHGSIARGLAGAGLVLAGAGAAAHWYDLPMNKPLWTSAYVLFSGGAAMVVIASCYLISEQFGWRRLLRPLEIFGLNAIVLFVGSGLLARVLGNVRVGPSGGSWSWSGVWGTPASAGDGLITLQKLLFQRGFEPWFSPEGASLAYAAAMLALWWVVCWAMWKRKWFVRV